MTGLDAKPSWLNPQSNFRDHVLVENRHNPTTMFMKTCIDQRYKITVHYKQSYGEIYDLQEDPGEYKNLWDSPEHQDLKRDLLLKLIHANMDIEPLPMPRIAGA
jgi:uncharacterized sulfatase